MTDRAPVMDWFTVEEHVLGFLLCDKRPATHLKAANLHADDFEAAEHGSIFDQIVDAINAGRRPNPYTLRDDPADLAYLLDMAEKAGGGDKPDTAEDFAEYLDLLPKRRARLANGVDPGPPPPPPPLPPPIETNGVSLADFHAYMPAHSYIFTPTGQMWPTASINARIKPIRDGEDGAGKPKLISASAWLDRNKPVEQMTWAPGEPPLIRDRLSAEGGWIERPGVTCFNLYRAPAAIPGDASRADLWLSHVRILFPEDAEHILNWLAHRVQHPKDKINHALVLGGLQGIGKDTLLEPVKYAIGPWNFGEVSPVQILGRFNGFLKSVILRISEARDLGEFDRFRFYDHMKAYTANPPDSLRVDEKNLREYSILNCCGVIVTTNHKTDGIYLPADDRRHYVAWSNLTKDDFGFQGGYWNKLWDSYRVGGIGNVCAYLRQRDLTSFDPKAPPQKTNAFWAIVDAARAPEQSELADVIDALDHPKAVILATLSLKAVELQLIEFADWLRDRKNRRIIPHRLEQCGYVPVRNPDDKRDGQWRINERRQSVYAQITLTLRDQIAAAQHLARR